MTEVLLQALAQGIMMGAIYALVAAGVTLIFGVMKVINFAHGEFLMVAMYGTYALATATKMDPYLAVFFITPLMYVLGILVYRYLIAPIINADHIMQAQMTLGILIVLTSLMQTIYTSNELAVVSSVEDLKIYLGPIILKVSLVLAFIVAIVISIALYWLLQRTDLGRMIRAVAQSHDTAGLMGINTERIYHIVFGLGIAALGVSAVMLIPFLHVSPHVGAPFTFLAFVIVVLGGMGNYLGALAGGLIVGVAESISSVVLSPHLAPAIIYGLFVLILLFRPQGLFGGASK